MISRMAIVALAACGGGVVEPSKPAVTCWDCDALEPSTGRRPTAYATYSTFHVATSWSGLCEPEFSFGLGAYTDASDPHSPVVCKEVAHDASVACDGGACTIAPAGMHAFDVTPRDPGNIAVRATLAPVSGKPPKDVVLGRLRIEKPTRISARCHEAVEEGHTYVLVDLYSAQNQLLSGGMPAVSVAGGDACTAAPLEPAGPHVLPWRRYRCKGTGKLDLEVKGADFVAHGAVECGR